MAVVSGASDLIPQPYDDTFTPADPHEITGKLRLATGYVTCASTDSSGSMYELARIPSHAFLHEDTFFDVENWGFAQIVIGTQTDTDALVDQTLATENTVTPIAVGDANHGNHLWEVLGMAADPGGLISLFIHAEAGATGDGNMPFRIAYIVP